MEERNSTISLSRVQSRTCSGYAEAGNGRKKFKINLLPEFMFIVLEGLDGAGKSTQIRMLQELFARRGVACRYLHFPRFDAPVFGDLIARFLRGELGTVEAVDPYLVALLFAGDRGDAAAEIRQWLASGEAVVLDRYVYSNVAFQCAKLSSEEERRALKRWILDTEYGYYRLPRPDVSLFLDVPFSFTERKLTQARERGLAEEHLRADGLLGHRASSRSKVTTKSVPS